MPNVVPSHRWADSERREEPSLSGTPGLANDPIIGRIFAANKTEVQETDIVVIEAFQSFLARKGGR